MIIRVDWQVFGSSTIDVTDEELREAADAGVDLEDYNGVRDYLVDSYGKAEFYRDIVSDFDEMEAPDIIDSHQEGQPPQWWYDEYLEYDKNGEFIGFKERKVTDD